MTVSRHSQNGYTAKRVLCCFLVINLNLQRLAAALQTMKIGKKEEQPKRGETLLSFRCLEDFLKKKEKTYLF